MDKLYELITFINKRKPAINAQNLNKISGALNDIDDRVIEEVERLESKDSALEELIKAYNKLAVEDIFYNTESNALELLYGSGQQKEIGPLKDIRVDGRHIMGLIEGGYTSDNLAEMGISENLTVSEVFTKLPALCIAVIQNNAHDSAYMSSMPANPGAAHLIYRKVFNRGTILLSPIHGADVWIGKAIDGKVEWLKLVTSTDMAAYQAASATMLSGWPDTRDTGTKPDDYNGKLLPAGIKRNTAVGITDGGEYITLVGIRGWNDSSGGKSHEFGLAGNGKLYHRVGYTDTWEPWREIAHIDDINAGSTGDASTKVNKAGDIMTGNLEFAESGTGYRGIKGAVGANDAWRVMGGATDTNAGFLEIATDDDGNEPIYVRQYSGGGTGRFLNLVAQAVLLDDGHNTSFPGVVSGRTFVTPNGYAQISRSGGVVSTLKDLVEYVMFDPNARSGGGNAKLTADILGIGTGWVRYTATWQNPYNQDNYDIELALVIDMGAAHDLYHIDIGGKNGSYSVSRSSVIATDNAMTLVGYAQCDAWDAAGAIEFPGTTTYKNYILVAVGASSNSNDTGWDDYGRVIFITRDGTSSANNVWASSTLGTYYSGSTARFSVDKTASHVTLKVPKGSWAGATLYALSRQQ